MNYEVMQAAFEDELQKIAESYPDPSDLKYVIFPDSLRAWHVQRALGKKKTAGELQGHVRAGRRPLHVDTLLKKEKDSSGDSRKKIADITKLSSSLMPSGKTVAGLVGGAYLLNEAQKTKRRYLLGRQIELQNQAANNAY